MKNQNKKIKKTVIILGYQCNNKCQFCLDANKRNLINKTTEQIMREMALVKEGGCTYLELIGGEPTIRPDIVELIKFARQLKFKNVVMATNGRLFAYRKFAEKIIKAGLTDLIFSIHGHNSKLHDSLTRSKGSFRQMMQGIKNVRTLGLKRLGTNTTIVKQNYRFLKKIGQLILRLGFRNSEFIFVDPTYGAAHDHFLKFVPKISEAAPYIHQCLDLGKGKTLHWDIRYVPLCYFTDYLNQISELHESITFHTQHLAPDYINLDVENARKNIARTKTKRCSGCSLYNRCEGIWKEYFKQYGDRELNPNNQGIWREYLKHYSDKELNPIKDSRSLIYLPEFGDYSGNASELICLKHKIRKIVQIDLNSQRQFIKLRTFAKNMGLGVVRSYFKSNKKMFRGFIFVPKKIRKEEKNLRENKASSEEVGKLMGYPSCCIKSYTNCAMANRDISNCMHIKEDSSFNYLINPFVKFAHNAYLINHFPCSLHCKNGIKLAKKICKIIKKKYPSLYAKMYESSHYPILFFPDLESNYDLGEGIDFIMFKSKQINKNKIAYNNIIFPQAKKSMLPIIRDYANPIMMGNNILISKQDIRVFLNDKFICKINRKNRKSYFLFPR